MTEAGRVAHKSSSERATTSKNELGGLLAILAFTLLVYTPTLGFDFVYDDLGQILGNPQIQSWSNLIDDFTGHVWAGYYPDEEGLHYRPIFLLWLRIQYSLFGDAAWGWHLATVLCHLVATSGFFFVARRVLTSVRAAQVATVIFALHPAHVESVAWISGVTDPLMVALGLPAFLLALRSWEKDTGVTSVPSLALYALALGAKEMAVAIPALLFVHGLVDGQSSLSARMKESAMRLLPFAGLTLLYFVARAAALGVVGREQVPLSAAELVRTWPVILTQYLTHLVWPVGLSPLYDTPVVEASQVARLSISALAILFALGVLYTLLRSSSRVGLLGLCWFVIPLAPVLQLNLLPRGEFFHDRYLYLPLAGFALLVAGAVQLGLQHSARRERSHVLVCVALALLLGAGTLSESRPWQSSLTLYQRAVEVAPKNAVARNNLATELILREDWAGATPQLRIALQLDPDFAMSHHNLALALLELGQLEGALDHARRATSLDESADNLILWALVLRKQRELESAAAKVEEAIRLEPTGRHYHYLLGQIRFESGSVEAAVQAYESGLVVHPEDAVTQSALAEARAELRRRKAKGGPRAKSPRQPRSPSTNR